MSQKFIDVADIQIASGNGGDGVVAWRREKYVAYGGPAGGDGGKGGDVYIKASARLNTLLSFQHKHIFEAQHGGKGENKNCHGSKGQDLVIEVPCGTVIRDQRNNKIIGDLTLDGEQILIAQGGRGGRGNNRFASSKRQSPSFAEPGEPGIIRDIRLEIKLLADIGLLGLPNAGKSTLLSVLSKARPKIADYPFTTLTPNLGVATHKDTHFVIADIPGLIEGASEGHGLGHDFLRHVERNRLLWHLLDLSELASHPPEEAYALIRKEVETYSKTLAEKPELIVLSKSDTLDDSERLEALRKYFEALSPQPVFVISAAQQNGLEALLDKSIEILDSIPKQAKIEDIDVDTDATNNDDSAFYLDWVDDETVFVMGGKVERLARVTQLDNGPAVQRLVNIYKAMGVFKLLKKEATPPGTTVIIGNMEFVYDPGDIEREKDVSMSRSALET